MVSNSSNTATALRWRARTVKDAVHPDLVETADDSRIHLSVASNEDFSDYDGKKDRALPFSAAAARSGVNPLGLLFFQMGNFSWMNMAIRSSALMATFTSIISTIGHHKTWFMAIHCTTTVTLSIVLLYQLERFHVLHNVRYQIRKTRQSVRRLSVQRDALTQHILQQQERQAQLSEVEDQLHRLQQTSGKSLQDLQRLAQDYRQVTQQMQLNLQRELQQQVLSLVLDSDANGDFRITRNEWRRLQLRLKNTPGMDVVLKNQQENLILLDDDDDDDQNNNQQDSVNVMDVLRRLEQQQQQQQSSSFPKPPRHRRRPSTSSSVTSVQLTSNITVVVDPQKAVLRHKRHVSQGEQRQDKDAVETLQT